MIPPPLRPARVPIHPALLVPILVAAMGWQWAMLPIITSDLPAYNIPWLEHIVAAGPFRAFAAPFANYTPPYLYLLATFSPLAAVIPAALVVKLVSYLCNALLAAAFWRLLGSMDVAQRGRWMLLFFCLPTVMINAALLGQCDGLYVAPCIMAVTAAIERRHRAMFAWAGLALAIKAQALLGAPFLLAVVIARQVPVRLWFYAPLGFAAALAPAALAGWPVSDLLAIYARQAGTFSDIARNAPNIWMVAQALGGGAALTGLALAMAIGAAAAYAARTGATFNWLTPPMQLRAALLAPMLMAGLLPKMHDRYFFMADILSFALAIVAPSRDTWRIQAYVQLGSVAALMAYLMGVEALAVAGALPMMVATWLAARPLLLAAANDNPLLPQRAASPL